MKFRAKKNGITIILVLFSFFCVLQLHNISKIALYTYNSPEEVIEKNYNFDNISLSIIGEETACVVSEEGDSSNITIIPKTDTGWKNATNINTRRLLYTVKNNLIISVYTYKKTQDFYIRVCSVDKSEINISDNRDSLFLVDQSQVDKYVYYAYVKSLDESYCLYINENEITLEEDRGRLIDPSVTS